MSATFYRSGETARKEAASTDSTPPAAAAAAAATLGASVVSVAQGFFHTCAVLSGSGGVLCWGYNRYGQLGTGDRTDRLSPTAVGLGAGACARGCCTSEQILAFSLSPSLFPSFSSSIPFFLAVSVSLTTVDVYLYTIISLFVPVFLDIYIYMCVCVCVVTN